jgi:hypothetical protein
MVQEQRRWQAGWVRRIADEIASGELEWFAGVVPEKRGATPSWLNEEVQQ